VAALHRGVLDSYLGIYAAIAPSRVLGDQTRIACHKGDAVSKETTYESLKTSYRVPVHMTDIANQR
jgi:hypothetical protein